MLAYSMVPKTWTEYLKNSKLYGVGKEWPESRSLLINTKLASMAEKCYFEKCIAYFKFISLCPMTEDESLAFTIFQLTCSYIREHDNIDFEQIHRHTYMDYSIDVVDRVITLTDSTFSSDKFKVKAILIESYKGEEDDISIEYYPEQKRYHSYISIADLGIKYSMSFDSIGQEV